MRVRPLFQYTGSKYRSAEQIVQHLPSRYTRYFEPFVGGASILAHARPARAVAADLNGALIEMWHLVQREPDRLVQEYLDFYYDHISNPRATFTRVRSRFNRRPNGSDFFFILQSSYAGIIRFNRRGEFSSGTRYIGVPRPEEVSRRVQQWHGLVRDVKFVHCDFESVVERAGRGDFIYADPPYLGCERPMYGAYSFEVRRLYDALQRAKARGARIALSIDAERAGRRIRVKLPEGLFEQNHLIHVGPTGPFYYSKGKVGPKSMPMRDRLLLSWGSDA